jgi:hypothetical protein
MRAGGIWAVCAVILLAAEARGQDAPADPLSDPFFRPASAEVPAETLSSAVAAPDARAVTGVCPDPCPSAFTYWARAEWLVGRTRGVTVSPLATTGPATNLVLAGTVGLPSTVPLFGGRRYLNDWRSGLRVEAGMWFDADHQTGVSARLYSLFAESDRFAGQANGTTVVNVPHYISVGGATVQIPVFVGFPGLAAGTVQTSARTTFTGGDVNWRRLLTRGDNYRVELLAGYRQMYLGDELQSSFAVNPIGLASLALTRLTGADAVQSRNDFFGPQLGLFASAGWNRLALDGHAALALGVTASEVNFARARSGGLNPLVSPALTAAGVPPATTAAVASAANAFTLSRPNTSGRVSYFGAACETGLRASYRVTDHVRLSAGYGFLYWNNVRRAQEEFASGAPVRARAVDYAAHFFTAGLDLRY